MATIDEELRMDEQDDLREVAFIRTQLPSELKEKFSDDDLLWMLDSIVTYYYESGDDEVDIDMEAVSDAVCRQAAAEGRGPLVADEVFFVVQADLDYQEEHAA